MQLVMTLSLAVGLGALAPQAAGAAEDIDPRVLDLESESAPVLLDGKELFRVKGSPLQPADRRAAVISSRLQGFAADRGVPVEGLRLEDAGSVTLIIAGEQAIVGVSDADSGERPRDIVAAVLLGELGDAVKAYRAAREPRALMVNTGYALLWTAVAAVLLYGLMQARRKLLEGLRARILGGGLGSSCSLSSSSRVGKSGIWREGC